MTKPFEKEPFEKEPIDNESIGDRTRSFQQMASRLKRQGCTNFVVQAQAAEESMLEVIFFKTLHKLMEELQAACPDWNVSIDFRNEGCLSFKLVKKDRPSTSAVVNIFWDILIMELHPYQYVVNRVKETANGMATLLKDAEKIAKVLSEKQELREQEARELAKTITCNHKYFQLFEEGTLILCNKNNKECLNEGRCPE